MSSTIAIKDSKIRNRIEKYYENHDPDDAEKAAEEITTVIVAFVYKFMDNDSFIQLRKEVYEKCLKETKKRLLRKLLMKEK